MIKAEQDATQLDPLEAEFADAEMDWVEFHGKGQRKHGSAIGLGHGDREFSHRDNQPDDDDDPGPRNPEMEKLLLGSLMLNPARMDDPHVAALNPKDFHQPEHAKLFACFLDMHKANLPIGDLELVADRLKQSGDWDFCGGVTLLTEIHVASPTSANAEFYANCIKRDAIKRRLKALCLRTALHASNGHSPDELIDELSHDIDVIGQQTSTDRFELVTSADLANGDHRMEYHIDGVLAKGQHGLLAGMYKTLKTSIAVDLAIAIAICGMFLGFFRVLRAARVLFMTAESGLATIQETALRICRAAGVVLEEIDGLLWSTDLPRPHKAGDMAALRTLLKRERIEVLILDPAYLMLPGDDVANLFKQGEVLGVLSGVCTDLGVTLILIHHAKKTVVAQHEPMELADAAMAGFAEFSRQWILLSRREKYEPGSGCHRLWLNIGGSAGHSSLHGCDIDEGVGHGCRHWDVELLDPAECRQDEEERRQDTKEQQLSTKDQALLKRVVGLLVKLPEGETVATLRERLAAGPIPISRAINLGIEQDILEPCEITKPNRKATYPGYRLTKRSLTEAV